MTTPEVEVGEDDNEGEEGLAGASTVICVLTTGHAPRAVHDLKWMVCVPGAMTWPMTSMS
jgi:hypothetical protein